MICARCLSEMVYEHGEYFCKCGLVTDVVGSYTREYYQSYFAERTIASEGNGEPDFDPEEEDY